MAIFDTKNPVFVRFSLKMPPITLNLPQENGGDIHRLEEGRRMFQAVSHMRKALNI